VTRRERRTARIHLAGRLNHRELTAGTLAGAALILLGAACTDGATFSTAAQRRGHADRDTAFAAVQSRGEHAMGVDQYTSTHVFTPLPDGGRIELQRDQVETSGTRQIRQHMHQIAAAFRSGDFVLPGFIHGGEVPGTAVMAARRAAITYAVEPLPGGAALRLQTRDTGAVQAIHEFLAFQRADHHAAAR
jgi:hypothetical protein